MAIGQGGRHESFKWGRAALTATNDEIVTLVTLGWEIGRVVESGDPLDEEMEKAVADYKATMSQLDKADLMASLVVSKIMQGEPYTLATLRFTFLSKRAYPSFFAIVPIRKWRRTSINMRDFGHAKKD